MGKTSSAVEAAAARALKRERADTQAMAERDALLVHLKEQDDRLNKTKLHKQALEQKRLADAFDPKPARRTMYDDKMCAQAAEVPGPAEYNPRLTMKDSEGGKTFSSVPFASFSTTGSQVSTLPDRDAGSLDAYRVKVASQMPGPASYSPTLGAKRGTGGSAFGPPPERQSGKPVPSAHDVGWMVAHLKDLPAPDAYSPRRAPSALGFRMGPPPSGTVSVASSTRAGVVPGPGTYDLSKGLSPGRATLIRGSGKVKSELDIAMDLAKDLPGPGAYDHKTQMRSKGSPRFSKAGGNSMIEAIMEAEKKKPGPDAYFPTPTFANEQQMRQYKRDVIKGLIPA